MNGFVFDKRIDITPFEHELRNIRARLRQFQTTYSDYLQLVRNNTAAHKDQDVLKQLDIITNINWSETIQTTITFERIINDLGAFLQKLISSGLVSLKNFLMLKPEGIYISYNHLRFRSNNGLLRLYFPYTR